MRFCIWDDSTGGAENRLPASLSRRRGCAPAQDDAGAVT